MAETMLPAAPVTRKTVSWSSVMPGWPSAAGRLRRPTVQRCAVLVADLDCAGIAQGFRDQQLGDFRGVAFGLEIDGFDEGVGALAFVGLGEAGNGSAQGAVAPASS